MKPIRKLRRKSYFVGAAIQVLESGGLEEFTARNVAEKGGYNASSIYTYFKNLDHLENLASIHFTGDYINQLEQSYNKYDDSFVLYLNMWILFSIHAMKNPYFFYNVFFATITQTQDLNLWDEYYEIYPDRKPTVKKISGMVELPKTRDREIYIMDACIQSKAIDEKYAEYIMDVHLGYFKNILTDIVKNDIYTPSVAVYQKHMINFIYVMYKYVDEKYLPLLDDMLEFYSEERTSYLNYFEETEELKIK